MKLRTTSGNNGAVDGTACTVGVSSAFTPTLTTTSNAFCGTGAAHTPVTYTSTPANDEDRIREVVGTHCAGSCTQRVSPIRKYSLNKPAISAVNNIINYRAWVEK